MSSLESTASGCSLIGETVLTSDSDSPPKPPPKGRGGWRQGGGRPKGSKGKLESNAKKPRKQKSKAASRCPTPSSAPSLAQPLSDGLPSDQSTSESEDEELERKAQKRAKSTEAQTPPLSPMPDGSSVSAYARWAVQRLSNSECQRICQGPRRIMSFCTGMATEVIVGEATVQALQHCGHKLQLTHVVACELDQRKMKFIKKHFPVYDHYVRDVGCMSKELVLDDRLGEVVPRPKTDALVAGFSCKDISGLTTKPKSERGGHGTSANTLQGILNYLESLPLEERPKLVILENVPGSVMHFALFTLLAVSA